MIADAARAHPDGTFSLLRGGIDRLTVAEGQPLRMRGSILGRITGSINEAGPHTFRIRVVNEDGQQVAPEINGSFNVPEGGGSAQLAIDFDFNFPDVGRYTFSLTVDNHESDTWEVRAVRPEQAGEAQE